MVLRQACGFVVGFGLAFVALGATASLIGGLLRAYEVPLRQVSGLLIAGFGVAMTGLLPAWVLGREVRPGLPAPGGSPPAAAAMGLAFGFGWTPCVGPALASILLVAGTVGHVARGTELLAVFAAGLGLPFLAVAACFDRLRPWMRRAAPALPWVRRAAGVLMVALGWLVFTGDLSGIATALTSGTAL
jgi:cytochrome c-type biogenesis protein